MLWEKQEYKERKPPKESEAYETKRNVHHGSGSGRTQRARITSAIQQMDQSRGLEKDISGSKKRAAR